MYGESSTETCVEDERGTELKRGSDGSSSLDEIKISQDGSRDLTFNDSFKFQNLRLITSVVPSLEIQGTLEGEFR